MVFFDNEAASLRVRWQTMDTKAVNFAESPFGLTVEGLQDFRGYCVKGILGAEHIISKQRFEKCDLSFSRFAHCKIIDSWFVSCKLYAVDFHSCEIISCPKPNCTWELVVNYQPPHPPPGHFEEQVRQASEGLDGNLLIVRKLDQIQLADFDRSIIYCLSLSSAPSLEAFIQLTHLLTLAANPPQLIVLDQDDLSNLSAPERQLVKTLFDTEPCGLAEVAWVLGRKILASTNLATVPLRDEIIQGLKLLGAEIVRSAEQMTEDRFWQIVSEANPDSSPYLPQAHADRLVAVLRLLSDNELMQFEWFVDSLCKQVYTFEMSEAASTIGTGCGDDSFSDFCTALIYRGRIVFYEALRNPEERLMNLESAHYLLLEGFGYLLGTVIKKRPELFKTLTAAKTAHFRPITGLGGVPLADDQESLQKCFPKLFRKYWAKDEFRVMGALTLDTSGLEAVD